MTATIRRRGASRAPAGVAATALSTLVVLATAAGCTGPSLGTTAPTGVPTVSATPTDIALAQTTTTCPSLPRTPPRLALPGAATQLVPFAPTSVLLCLYAWDPLGADATHSAYSLAASREVTDAALAREVRDRIQHAARPWPTGPVACPNDIGTLLDAYFRTAIVEEIEVEVSTTGCPGATNGTLSMSDGEAVPYLEDLVPFPPGLR